MFNRIHDILLQKEYREKTEKIRGEYEELKNGISSFRQELDEIRNIKNSLASESKMLGDESIKLSFIIESQKKEILENKNIINNFKNEESKLFNKKCNVEDEIKEINLLRLDVNDKYEVAVGKLISTEEKIKKNSSSLDKIILEINNKKIELEKQEKRLKETMYYISNKEIEFKELSAKNEKDKQDNDNERTLLNIYRERLNIHYKKIGINITL